MFHFFTLNANIATLGNALTYIYPAMMYQGIVTKQGRKNEGPGLAFAIISAVLGLIMGAVGTFILDAVVASLFFILLEPRSF